MVHVMAEIPTNETMERRIGRPDNSIAQGQRRAPVYESAEGATNLYRQLGNVGEQIFKAGIDLEKIENDRRERENRLAIVNAKANFQKANMGIKAGINDEDYGTFISRYDEGISKARSEILETVKDPYAREMLQADLDVSIEEGKLAMFSKSQKVEADLGRAQTENIMESQLELLAAAESEGDYEDGLNTIQETIQTAQKNKYITAEQAEDKWDQAKESYATTRYNALEPEQQLEVLEKGSGWIEHIPAAKRVVAKKQAQRAVEAKQKANETDLLKAKALKHVDDWEDLGKTEEEMYLEAEKLPPKERLYAEDRINKNARKNDALRADRANDNYDEWHRAIQGNTEETGSKNFVSYADIPDPVLDEMTPGQRDSLKALSAERFNELHVRTVSDQSIKDQLYVLAQDETEAGRRASRTFYSENAHLLSAKDRDVWSKATSNAYKQVPIEIKGLFTAQQQVKQAAAKVKLNDELTGRLQDKMSDWYTNYQMANAGKLPSDLDVQKTLDQFMLTDSDFFSGNEYAFEDLSEIKITPEFINRTDPYNYKRLEQQFINKYGKDYNKQDLVDTWKSKYGNR